MKSKEELSELKTKLEKLNEELKELSDEELAAVTAGAKGGKPVDDESNTKNKAGARTAEARQQICNIMANGLGVEGVNLASAQVEASEANGYLSN